MLQYTLCTPIRMQTPDEYYQYVMGLRINPETAPDSKAAKGIKLFPKKDKLIVKCTRETKTVTTAEIELLAIEYGLDKDTLYTTLNERKYVINNELGEQLNGKPTKSRKRRPARTKADAHIDQNRDRASHSDELFFTGADSDMPQESPLHIEHGSQEG